MPCPQVITTYYREMGIRFKFDSVLRLLHNLHYIHNLLQVNKNFRVFFFNLLYTILFSSIY